MDNWNKTRQDIGNRIEQLRTGKGLTQADLAAEMSIALGRNISRETVKQWERGERDLKTEYTVALADFFGTNCDFLLRGINSQNTTINAALGLSDTSINTLRKLNENSTLRDLAKPGFDRLLSSPDVLEFLGYLNSAFYFHDIAPTEQFLELTWAGQHSTRFTEEERTRLASAYKEAKHNLDRKDLFEYKAQQSLVSIIRLKEKETE